MKTFWDKVNRTETCWLWTGCKKTTGYGTFQVGRPQKHKTIGEL